MNIYTHSKQSIFSNKLVSDFSQFLPWQDMSHIQGLKVASTNEGKKCKTLRTPFWFFMMEKKQQWEQEGRWDGRGGTEALVKVGQ